MFIMTNFKDLNEKVFMEISEKFNDNDLISFKNELLFVHDNEIKYRCQQLDKKKSTIHFKYEKDTGKCIFDNNKKEKNEILPYLNFYHTIDNIFKKLYEKYNYDKYLFSKKQELLSYYDNQNSHRFVKCDKLNWKINENGEIVIEDKK